MRLVRFADEVGQVCDDHWIGNEHMSGAITGNLTNRA